MYFIVHAAFVRIKLMMVMILLLTASRLTECITVVVIHSDLITSTKEDFDSE